MKSKLVFLAIIFVLAGAVGDRVLLQKFKVGDSILNTQRLVSEESVVIDVVEKVSLSVVTVGIKKTITQPRVQFFDPFGFFVERDIGSGFVISAEGLIVTNKHVVADGQATYRVITKDDKTFDVVKIYRDPANDLAILKIDASGLQPVEMGDSDKLKVGQMAIAIGTALGEFRHTVTTGVVSGLGRGITAGSPFEGFAEKLDNVIQTDAAINPGNSGGPLLNSSGQVVGVNAAVSSEGQNIGFAIPINVVKDAIDNFNKTGQFSRPYLGVRYRVIDQKTAILNEVPQGSYVQEVVADSPAEKAGIDDGDIITDPKDIAKAVSGHKVGDRLEIKIWRDGENKTLNVTLEEAK